MSEPYQVENKPQEKVQPKELKKIGSKELKITWSDGHVSIYSFRYLRQNCQCALCVDEWTGKGVLLKEKIPQDLEGLKVNVVGSYALGIDFSDRHSTGIYAFSSLREICPCGLCSQEKI